MIDEAMWRGLIHEQVNDSELLFNFFFQAEDGIRERDVTGVQTCALPIYVTCFPFDLASNVQQQATSIFNEIGTFDILINNAGYLVNKPFPEITHEDYTLSYQINVIGVMETVQSALIHLNKTSSHIVNISSMGGFQSSMKFPGLTAYSTSKAALCSFTELFSEEYKETSIAMNCLCLGSVQTEMLEEAFPGYIAPLKPEEISEYICDFSLNAHRFMKGKILPLSLTNP